MVFSVKIQSFGKVELNLASTPSLECLRRKLSEESLIWLSKCPSTDEIISTLPRWYFRQCEHSRSLIRRRESCLFINSKKIQSKNLQQSLLVKLNQIRKLLGETLIWPSTWTILSRSRCPGRGKALLFQFLKNLQATLVFRPNNKMASSQNPVKKQLLQFTAPKAKNRQNFAGGWLPGMFIEA